MNKSNKKLKLLLPLILLLNFNTIGHTENLLILDSGHDPKFKGAIAPAAIVMEDVTAL